MGIRESILVAKTIEEVDALLKKGDTFEFASNKTRNSWRRAAERRIAQLIEAARAESREGNAVHQETTLKTGQESKQKKQKQNRKRRKDA